MKLPLSLLGGILCATSAQALIIDFSSGTDFADNFRRASTITSSHSVVQSGALLSVTGSTVATNAVGYVYDTTPANNTVQSTFSLNVGETITVSIDIGNLSANAAGSSLGIYFINPTAETTATNFLALMNFNSAGGGSHEQFRFASNATLANTGNGGTLTNGSIATADTGITVSDSTFRTITATYTYNSATSVSMSLAAGSVTSTRDYTSVSALNTLAIGLRIAPAAGSPARTFQLDNFQVIEPSAIPEPSTYAAIAGLAMLGFVASRRARR